MADEKVAQKIEEIVIPEELSILPSSDLIVFPFMISPLQITEPNLVKLIDNAAVGEKIVGLVALKGEKEMANQDLYAVGTAVNIARMLKMPDGTIHVLLQGIARIKIVQVTQDTPYLRARVERLEEVEKESVELEALVRNVSNLFQKVVSLTPNVPEELSVAAANIQSPGRLADFVAANISLALANRQQILESLDVTERLKKLTSFLNKELEILEIGSKIQSEIRDEMTKSQREYYLREQLRAIQKELGETDEKTIEINELREKINGIGLPPEALKEAERELDRLEKMPPQAAEYTTARTYLDWVVNLPWNKSTEDNLDINAAEKVLNEDHYDLDKVKGRILEYLAVRRLKPDTKGPILCFVGPPGVGKTSLGHSIARALGRKFVRMSLGGIRDEAEIRGHRRTYVGALPGRILQAMRTAESNNPVFMLDEVDKIGVDFRGDPSAALLEVLDPEQNHSFSDNYLDVPFDLSKVMFITTANILDPVPPALRDRMEVLDLPGYTEAEKLHIAKKFLVPRQVSENGLTPENLKFTDEAISDIIRSYTREAGVRNLEREIATVCRKVAKNVAAGKIEPVEVKKANLHEFLGPIRFRYEVAEVKNEVGVATGLAWTETGGDVLFVEASLVPGKGNLILTGKLGEVMQESAKAAVTYARSRASALGIPTDFYDNFDIHIHVPAGAIPKDGPSAGVTMATALVSALTQRAVNRDVGMTGEITLRGKVLPIGGIKEKTLAAHRAGLKTIVLPKENYERDMEDIPDQIRKELKFVPVEHIDEALKVALEPKKQELAVTAI